MIDSKKITFSRFREFDVPRETFERLELFQSMIIEKNKEINLISSKTEAILWDRHILDSAQTIDFIDKNDIKICTDLGSGAGLPGIVLGILMKPKKPLFKLIFYEKSYHKSVFLKEMTKKFNLNSEIHQKNVFEEKNLSTDVIISRAFKPLPIIFQIAKNNFKNFKYIILFLGKSGKKILDDAFVTWKFDYEEKKSLTNDESMIVKISNLRKKKV